MEILKVSPKGKVQVTYTWKNNTTTFYTGTKQFRRKRVKAAKSYVLEFAGLADEYEKLIGLYNNCQGALLPFSFEYDGITEDCFFQKNIEIEQYREVGELVGYVCSMQFEVETQKKEYPTATTDDILNLVPIGHTKVTYDWNTSSFSSVSTGRKATYTKPIITLTAKFSGSKAQRDHLIDMFNSHNSMPFKFTYNGKLYDARFGDSLNVVDNREVGKIVGFEAECDIQLISLDEEGEKKK